MPVQDKNVLNYIVVCVSEFASRHNICMKDAYAYLRKYKGIDFLIEHYMAEHTLSFDDAVDDLTVICSRNGGALA